MSTIGVFARRDLRDAAPVIRELARWLHARGVRVCLEEATATLGSDELAASCLVASGRDMAGLADALVVLGGDGTLLAASRLLDRTIPVLGVNFGSLGFLTEITRPELFDALGDVVDGRATLDERMMLAASVKRGGAVAHQTVVLNDVVFTRTALSRIIDLAVWVGDQFVTTVRADGLILASPTGSTAYNLAAGGPIVHPAMEAFVLTPIAPHTLSNRPIVVPAARDVRVIVTAENADAEAYVSFDGQSGLPLEPGDEVVVGRAPRPVKLVRATTRTYFEVLRQKLMWGERQSTPGA